MVVFLGFSFIIPASVLSERSYQRFSITKDEFTKKFEQRYPYLFYPSYRRKGSKTNTFLREVVFDGKNRIKIKKLKKEIKPLRGNFLIHDYCFLPQQLFNELECSVCFEKKKNILTPCGHLFCKTCLLKHYCSQSRRNKDCPMCRTFLGKDMFAWLRKSFNFGKLWERKKALEIIEEQEITIDLLRGVIEELREDDDDIIVSVVFDFE